MVVPGHDGIFVELDAVDRPHLFRLAVARPAQARFAAREIEVMLEDVRFQLVLGAQLQHQFVRLLVGVRAGEAGAHDHPRAVRLGQLVRLVRIGLDLPKRNELGPRRGGGNRRAVETGGQQQGRDGNRTSHDRLLIRNGALARHGVPANLSKSGGRVAKRREFRQGHFGA